MTGGRRAAPDFGARPRKAQDEWRDPLLTALTILLVLLMFVVAAL